MRGTTFPVCITVAVLQANRRRRERVCLAAGSATGRDWGGTGTAATEINSDEERHFPRLPARQSARFPPLQRAKALIFAAEEDFGILPVEAQACGTPVIALGKGGALETVRGPEQPGATGIFFRSQDLPMSAMPCDYFRGRKTFTPKVGTGRMPSSPARNASAKRSADLSKTTCASGDDAKLLNDWSTSQGQSETRRTKCA